MRASKKYTIWLTGVPASGKTTLAKNITDAYQKIYLIDSEEASKIITPSSSFSQKERLCVYNGLIYSALCLNNCGINVIIAATGNYRRFSEHAKKII
jgi:adenylylsulfate kinase-like enzyme